jgi:hypothetical protein
LYVGGIEKFPYFFLWQSFGLWLKFSEVYLWCNVLLQGIITCVLSTCHSLHSLALAGRVRHLPYAWVSWYQSQHWFDVSL